MQCIEHRCKRFILQRCVRNVVRAFQFDADRKIIAAFAPAPVRLSGMPGPPVERHELHERAVAADEQVRRDFHPVDFAKIRMRQRIKVPEKEFLDMRAAEFPRRQADAVHDHKFGFAARRSLVRKRRWQERNALDAMVMNVKMHARSLGDGAYRNQALAGVECSRHTGTR